MIRVVRTKWTVDPLTRGSYSFLRAGATEVLKPRALWAMGGTVFVAVGFGRESFPGLAGGRTVVSVRGGRPAQTLGYVVGGGQDVCSQEWDPLTRGSYSYLRAGATEVPRQIIHEEGIKFKLSGDEVYYINSLI